MAGGKQKRAAKLKRWKESQNQAHLQQSSSSAGEQSEDSGSLRRNKSDGDSGGGGDTLTENDLYKIRMEILRKRQKCRSKPSQSRLLRMLLTRAGNLKPYLEWMRMPLMICLSVVTFILCAFLLRSIIQSFFPFNIFGIEREPFYQVLRNTFPLTILKAVMLIDYFFNANSLSWNGVQNILLVEKDNYHMYDRHQ